MRKKLITFGAAALLSVPAFAGTAFAAGPYSGPGYDKAIANTPCADHGAFGYFGEQGAVHDLGINNLGSNGKPGADGQATGAANSNLCGNPQNG